MTMNMIGLALTAGVSFLIPVIIGGFIFLKNPMERKEIVELFFWGALIYLGMEWGIREQGLAFLFNHTGLSSFMNQHYIPYLLMVAVAGAVLAVLPELFVIAVVFKKQISFIKAFIFALGYSMMESVMLVGCRSIMTMIELIKNAEQEISTSTIELFLSGYERFLIMMIQIAVMVSFVYFIEHKMIFRGCLLKVFCHTLTTFLPGFFIAFSLKNYYEVYDRSVALILVYIVLTAAGLCSAVVINGLKYGLKDETVDSAQAVAIYRKQSAQKQEEKLLKKQKRMERKMGKKAAYSVEKIEGEDK